LSPVERRRRRSKRDTNMSSSTAAAEDSAAAATGANNTSTTTTAVLSEEIQSEIESLVGVQGLKHVPPPAEKVVLPSAGDIQQEKTELALHESIANFDSSALRHAQTEEKVVLPSADDIQQEKKRLSSAAAATDAADA